MVLLRGDRSRAAGLYASRRKLRSGVIRDLSPRRSSRTASSNGVSRGFGMSRWPHEHLYSPHRRFGPLVVGVKEVSDVLDGPSQSSVWLDQPSHDRCKGCVLSKAHAPIRTAETLTRHIPVSFDPVRKSVE